MPNLLYRYTSASLPGTKHLQLVQHPTWLVVEGVIQWLISVWRRTFPSMPFWPFHLCPSVRFVSMDATMWKRIASLNPDWLKQEDCCLQAYIIFLEVMSLCRSRINRTMKDSLFICTLCRTCTFCISTFDSMYLHGLNCQAAVVKHTTRRRRQNLNELTCVCSLYILIDWRTRDRISWQPGVRLLYGFCTTARRDIWATPVLHGVKAVDAVLQLRFHFWEYTTHVDRHMWINATMIIFIYATMWTFPWNGWQSPSYGHPALRTWTSNSPEK